MAKKANQKPASGAKPAAENTVGQIVPKTAPAPAGAAPSPPVKPETPKEKELLEKVDELLKKGEIKVLSDAKKGIAGGIDSLVNMAGGGAAAKIIGEIGKGAVEILIPDNVIDIIPGGKVLSGGMKAAKLGKKGLEKLGKEAAEKAAKEAAEKAAKEAAEKAAKEAAEKAAKEAAEKGAKKADVAGNKGGHEKSSGKKGKERDPCKHANDKEKRKYVVYKAIEYDEKGNPIGTYIGRTSGAPGESTDAILKRRLSGHHRNVKELKEVFETNSYAAMRGAEQLEIEKLRQSGKGVDQINGVGKNNKRKDDYRDCAKSKGSA